jgi:Protein required for attachment to host cells
MNTTWIVVADGTKACSYEYQGPSRPLNLVAGSQLQHLNEPSRNLVSSGPGRRSNFGTGQTSSMDPSSDPQRHEKAVFARKVGSFLEQRIEEFDDLVLVAPAKVLGDLRQMAPPRVLQKVSRELSKELTNLPAQELPRHLESVLNIDGNANPRRTS